MKTGYLKIENAGEIDIGAFRLLGASTKRDDASKIGFFGSGLKYAVAVLMREDIPFRVFSGNQEIKLTTKKVKMRDNEFNVICVNGMQTSLTTEMGPAWEVWFAVREVFCNAIDEGSHALSLSDMPQSAAGKTTFYIEIGPKLQNVLKNWNDYFSEKRSDIVHQAGEVKFFYGSDDKILIYRKGVQCYEADRPSIFHYDCPKISINESRVIESDYEIYKVVAEEFCKHASTSMISTLLEKINGKLEENFFWDYIYSYNRNWLTAIDERHLVPAEYAGNFVDELSGLRYIIVPNKLIKALQAAFPNQIKVVGNVSPSGEVLREPDARQATYIREAVDFLKQGGIVVDAKTFIVNFENSHILGRATKGEILLSPKLFDFGKKMIVAVILEEHSHLCTGYGDRTREFQDYLFNKIVSLMEEKIGKYL